MLNCKTYGLIPIMVSHGVFAIPRDISGVTNKLADVLYSVWSLRTCYLMTT
jgi:hypothetical protein